MGQKPWALFVNAYIKMISRFQAKDKFKLIPTAKGEVRGC